MLTLPVEADATLMVVELYVGQESQNHRGSQLMLDLERKMRRGNVVRMMVRRERLISSFDFSLKYPSSSGGISGPLKS